jgi:hypothetical protein
MASRKSRKISPSNLCILIQSSNGQLTLLGFEMKNFLLKYSHKFTHIYAYFHKFTQWMNHSHLHDSTKLKIDLDDFTLTCP